MVTRQSSKIWRVVVPSPDGPIEKPQRSEDAAREAGAVEKQTTTANRITVQVAGRTVGRVDSVVRTDNNWHAK
ncbi:hypothetical protein [Streptomyces geysiriensis]|uniref:hypothetical protein n=1 Tax=Streptomyces geysiriensis TaxID=68207 RepID=UPI001C7D074C|nr:hypothetical protein [Streptomyces geysiriensis]MBX4178451.1 hypothetical protein [Streptomyces geysiriensis]